MLLALAAAYAAAFEAYRRLENFLLMAPA